MAPEKNITKSLLRYPGGKTRGIATLLEYFPKNITELVSPFFGGGSLEFALADRGVRVYGYDNFSPLTAFWQSALTQPAELAAQITSYYPLSKSSFYEMQATLEAYKAKKLDFAARFFVLNRASFSGATCSGGMSPNHPRFTPSAIARVKAFAAPLVTVEKKAFPAALALHPDLFAYLDPPYLIPANLYGYKGAGQRGFDHQRLRKILGARKNWRLSYNDCPEIRRLYKGFDIVALDWNYGMAKEKNKTAKEILIIRGAT
jgi:DNA adenine methylase